MIINRVLTKLSGFWFWERWHPEVALRYLPIMSEIKKMGGNISILEVGSGGLGIVPYIKRPVTGADVNFYPPFHPLLKRVKADAKKLPFGNCSFDVVISVDTLEHMSASLRKNAISEMIRVAQNKVIISVPSGKLAFEQDLILDKLYKERFGKSYPFLEEQIGYGLPDKEEIRDTIHNEAKKHCKKINLRILGNENLMLRLFLMKGFINKNIFVNIFFRKILLFLIPVISRLNQDPAYRQIFLVDIDNENRN